MRSRDAQGKGRVTRFHMIRNHSVLVGQATSLRPIANRPVDLKTVFVCLTLSALAWAQRPSNPALLVPQEAPALDYVAVPDPLPVPANVNMGASSSVAFDSKGHLYVLSRGAQPITEFDENGKFIRS